MRTLQFTEKGWVGLCPIYSTNDGRIITRSDWYWWWLSINSFLLLRITLLLGGRELMFITAKLDKPIEMQVY